MARQKRELTRMKTPRHLPQRWRKKYQGSMYYFRGDYQTALLEWYQLRTRLDEGKPHRGEYQSAILTFQAMATWFAEHGDHSEAAKCRTSAADLQDRFDGSPSPPPLTQWDKPLALVSPEAKAVWRDRLANAIGSSADNTIGGAVEKFLNHKKSRVDGDELTATRYSSYRRCLLDFVAWVGADTPTKSIGPNTLPDYYEHLQGEVDKGHMARSYARDKIGAFKSFVRWAWRLELCELPRNLTSKDYAISVPPPQIKTFSIEEVKALLANAPDATRLYLLLFLNCGYTQADVAVLKHSEVDWTEGRIIRKRSKTKKTDSVPVVNYPLWSETFDLLKKLRSEHPQLVLTNANGLALKRAEILPSGRTRNTDNIRTAYLRLCTKIGIRSPLPPKLLRKTGATLLKSNPQFSSCDVLYLGQSPRTMADKHYSAVPQQTFDDAVKWLGETLGVD